MEQKPITRRALLKSILTGSAAVGASAFLPEKWVRPAVESVVLPVHAQVSAIPTATPNGRINGNGGIVKNEGGRGLASMVMRSNNDFDFSGVTVNLYLTPDACPVSTMSSTTKMARPLNPENMDLGTLIDTTITGVAGWYEFLGLEAGFYNVEFVDGPCEGTESHCTQVFADTLSIVNWGVCLNGAVSLRLDR
jgi:hypothetical protein